MAYFPIFEPDSAETYVVDWPFTESPMDKPGYSLRISRDYKNDPWGARFKIFNRWPRMMIWQAARVYAIGDVVRPVTANGKVYMAVVAGTSGGSEPNWGTTEEGTTSGGSTLLWACYDDSQLTALLNFIDARHGHVDSFNLWNPVTGAWVLALLPKDPIAIEPIRSGLYFGFSVEIRFERTR